MPILNTEVKWYRSKSVSDLSSNGGRMSSSESVTNVKNNIFPDVPQAERTAGSLKYRKMFIKFANDADLAASLVKVFVEKLTQGGDSITIFPGTQTDIQSGIGSPRLYGCGTLNANVSAGASTMTVMTEGVALGIFVNGDVIRISDKADILSAGNEEYVTINAAVTYGGDIATISFTPVLAAGYTTASATRVESTYSAGTVLGSCTAPNVTSAAGTYNNGGFPVILDHIGTVYELITLTFTSGTAFNASGDSLGSLGSGVIGSNFAPNNPDFSKPYFTVPSGAWGGTFLAGDTVTFTTTPAAIPVWYRRDVPASTGSQSNDIATVAVDFESA